MKEYVAFTVLSVLFLNDPVLLNIESQPVLKAYEIRAQIRERIRCCISVNIRKRIRCKFVCLAGSYEIHALTGIIQGTLREQYDK